MNISKIEMIVILFLIVILIVFIVLAPKGSYIKADNEEGVPGTETSQPAEATPPDSEETTSVETKIPEKTTPLVESDNSLVAMVEDSQETDISEQTDQPLIFGSAELDGRTYYDTGNVSNVLRCGMMDGNVYVSGTEYGYQISGENTIDVLIDDKWCIFEAEDVWGLSLTVQNITNTGLTYVFTQSGGSPKGSLQYGSDYIIEKLTDGSWTAVEYLPKEHDIAWTAEAYMIPKNAKTAETEIDWEWLYGELSTGTYRFGKCVMNFIGTGNFENKMYYAEFEINE